MIFTISSLIVLAGCMPTPWLAEAGGEGRGLAGAGGEGGCAPTVAARSSTPTMIRMPV
jgi:hypothetical protein